MMFNTTTNTTIKLIQQNYVNMNDNNIYFTNSNNMIIYRMSFRSI